VSSQTSVSSASQVTSSTNKDLTRSRSLGRPPNVYMYARGILKGLPNPTSPHPTTRKIRLLRAQPCYERFDLEIDLQRHLRSRRHLTVPQSTREEARAPFRLIHDLTMISGISGHAVTKNTAKERLSRRRVVTRVLRHVTSQRHKPHKSQAPLKEQGRQGSLQNSVLKLSWSLLW
jgi:hypothetical protein